MGALRGTEPIDGRSDVSDIFDTGSDGGAQTDADERADVGDVDDAEAPELGVEADDVQGDVPSDARVGDGVGHTTELPGDATEAGGDVESPDGRRKLDGLTPRLECMSAECTSSGCVSSPNTSPYVLRV